MATINYLYRSTKAEAFLNIRLLFRIPDKPSRVWNKKKKEYSDYPYTDCQIEGKTKIKVSKDYWKKYHKKTRIKGIDIKNKQTEVNNKISELENYILESFNNTDPEKINKDWLKNTINLYHNPTENITIPNDLTNFFDFYLERKKFDLSEVRKKRIKVVKHKLQRFEKEQNTFVHISSINEDFKNKYANYCNAQSYSPNTQQTELTIIKTVCNYARKMGLETHPDLNELRIKGKATNPVYLNFTEIEAIKNLELNNERLDNARDWLLISCYTAQRVSDFMRFNPEMIRYENGRFFLDFKQQKTNKLMSIPFIKEARELLNKRNGNFPKAISHQKHNDYIKEVCKLAGLDELTKGKIMTCIAPEKEKPGRNDYRRITGTFEKWELVSSHVGRRSFATNNYGKVPTTYLMYITGHSTEKMFLNYIKKSNKDLAADAYDYFN